MINNKNTTHIFNSLQHQVVVNTLTVFSFCQDEKNELDTKEEREKVIL